MADGFFGNVISTSTAIHEDAITRKLLEALGVDPLHVERAGEDPVQVSFHGDRVQLRWQGVGVMSLEDFRAAVADNQPALEGI